MNVEIKWFNDNFNIILSSAAGKEPFLEVKGCRIVDGQKGPFVSYPSKKNEQTGKYWNHCYGSDAFNAVVLSKAQEAMPKAPSKRQAAPAGGGGGLDDDIPFADPFKGVKGLVS